MNKLRYILLAVIAVLLMPFVTSCIEDGITTSPSAQPDFSTDTLKLGMVFTDEVTTTHRFTVRNRNDKGINISSIRMSGPNAGLFRLNVDGMSGTEFSDVEIRANDSIYVLVEATLPANGVDLPVEVESVIQFVTNGVTGEVVVTAQGQDVERLQAVTITEDTHLHGPKPYQIFDSLVVAPDVRLTLDAGTMLYFHDGARLIVRGTLDSRGTAESPVTLRGDRTGNVITDVTFDLMSRQWEGVNFASTSCGNILSHTCIRNTWYGVILFGCGTPAPDGKPHLTLLNCQLRNSGDRVLEAYHADVRAIGCEFGEASNGLVMLRGGNHVFNHCTFANYYLFSAISGPNIMLSYFDKDDLNPDYDLNPEAPFTVADFSNCISYGNGQDIVPGDLKDTGVMVRRCLFKAAGNDDDNFVECLWDADPLYYTVRAEYLFDYRLKPESPAIGAADPLLTLPEAAYDAYGLPRGDRPDLGAYVYTAPSAD